jgi:hypothetical protein
MALKSQIVSVEREQFTNDKLTQHVKTYKEDEMQQKLVERLMTKEEAEAMDARIIAHSDDYVAGVAVGDGNEGSARLRRFSDTKRSVIIAPAWTNAWGIQKSYRG